MRPQEELGGVVARIALDFLDDHFRRRQRASGLWPLRWRSPDSPSTYCLIQWFSQRSMSSRSLNEPILSRTMHFR